MSSSSVPADRAHEALRRKAWADAADELGIGFSISSGGEPTMSGSVEGIGVVVTQFNRGARFEAHYTVLHRPSGPRTKLQLDNSWRRATRLLGRGDDVQIGDPLFDKKVVVQTASPADLRSFLTPARRAALLDLFAHYSNCIVENDSISVRERSDWWTGPRKIVDTVYWLIDVAKIMQHPDALKAALATQASGNMAAAAADLHVLNEQQPNAFTARVEAQDLVELGKREQAAAIYDELVQQRPNAAGPDGWSDLAHAPSTSDVAHQQVSAVWQQDTLDALFDGTAPAYLAVELFDQRYARTTVTWRGQVESFSPYDDDADFGSGPGVKAIVLVGAAGQSKLVSNEVRAVLQLPADTALRRDSSISFTATMLRIERFSRHLYLAHAQLI